MKNEVRSRTLNQPVPQIQARGNTKGVMKINRRMTNIGFLAAIATCALCGCNRQNAMMRSGATNEMTASESQTVTTAGGMKTNAGPKMNKGEMKTNMSKNITNGMMNKTGRMTTNSAGTQ